MKRVVRLVSGVLLLALFCGCAGGRTFTSGAFTVPPAQEVLPILPFTGTLVPETFATMVFENSVDMLNDDRAGTSIKWFSIIKDDLALVTKALPPDNLYVTGELWSYIENSSCCATDLQVKARIRMLKAGTGEQLYEAEIPMSAFFEHDRSTLAVERERLAMKLARAMANRIIEVLKRNSPSAAP